MKVFLNDIKNISWLSESIAAFTWGKNFLSLKSGFYFVFNYDLLESESSIAIKTSQNLYEINDGIYRNMKAEHIGYMREPFDSTNYLFYSILKSSLTSQEDIDKLNELFVGYMYKDLQESKENLKVNLKANQQIISRLSFSSALNKIFSLNPNPVNGLCMVYDLIDQCAVRKTGKSIYGDYLTNIVRKVDNPNGGILPEYPNSKMRYLIIGEIGAKDDPKLKEAKELYRSGNSAKNIYLQTGWYFNKFDSKWRKRISDDTFYVKYDKVKKSGDTEYYTPPKYTLENFKKLSSDIVNENTTMLKAYLNGYDAKLGDFFSFDEAYELYPELKNILGLYSVNVLESSEYSFYFSPNQPNALVLVNGSLMEYTPEKIRFVALHEIQHYIQQVEGFGSGGNQNLASLVDAVGGSSIRSFFISLSNFQTRFSEVASLIPVQKFQELIDKLKNRTYKDYTIRYKNRFINASAYINMMYKGLENIIKEPNQINEKATDISYYIVTIYSMVDETNGDIERFIEEYVGKDYIELFKQALHQNRKAVERETNLAQKGWTAQDLYILNFQTYESLVGEIEARFTQQTTKIPKELKNYFEFYTSETINPSRVAVISDRILSDVVSEAALETYGDGKYVMHLPESFSNTINILHETGHILFDFNPEVLVDAEATEKAILLDFRSVEEYFCASFVDFIHRKNIDPLLTKELNTQREVVNFTDFDSVFESMLYGKSEIDEFGLAKRLDFVSKLME